MPPRGALDRILEVLQVPIATARAAILDRGFSDPDFSRATLHNVLAYVALCV